MYHYIFLFFFNIQREVVTESNEKQLRVGGETKKHSIKQTEKWDDIGGHFRPRDRAWRNVIDDQYAVEPK